MEKQFYTYLHCRPDGLPFYVGKGFDNRAYILATRNRHHRNIVAKYGKENIRVFIFHCDSEEQALADEMQQIVSLRKDGYKLANMSDGGEGMSNPSQEVRDKMSQSHRVENLSAETRLKLSLAGLGRANSPESIERGASKRRGRKNTLETRAKMSEKALGRKVSLPVKEVLRVKTTALWQDPVYLEKQSAAHKKAMTSVEYKEGVSKKSTAMWASKEFKEKMCAQRKGKPWSDARRAAQTPEVIAKHRAALLGCKHSEQARANMRAAHAKRKASKLNKEN